MVYVRKAAHTCTKCGALTLREDCAKNGLFVRRLCKPCYAEKMRNYIAARPEYRELKRDLSNKWARQNPEEKKRQQLKFSFGMTLDAYNVMLSAQNGVCAICQNTDTSVDKRSGKTRRLAVDHCHQTDIIRGLLCGDCNRVLGMVKESPIILMRMIEYLSKFQAEERRRSLCGP